MCCRKADQCDRATHGLGNTGGKGHNGGVFEWTSTTFNTHDGFKPSVLYPGYSTDFFDSHHQVVVRAIAQRCGEASADDPSQIGGSYATIPRQAERRTLRNYYQHNYPYAWVGGRVAYDI